MSQAGHHATACKGCRRRGRKCDRTLPACLSCQRRGVECEGYITRWLGVAARGKLAGKSIPVYDGSVKTTKPKPKRRNVPVSTGLRDTIEKELGDNSDDPHLNTMTSVGNDELEGLIKHCKISSQLTIECHG